MEEDIREIDSITFGIYSPEEIYKMSVCKIDSPKKKGPGTVYDPKMGTIDSAQACETCKQNATYCHGHFGRIELNEPIVHPLFYKHVKYLLQCICMCCHRLLLTKDQILLAGLNKYKGMTRFDKILEKIKKTDICCQPTGKLDENDEEILCEKERTNVKFNASDNSYSFVINEKTTIPLSPEEIKKIFDNIPNEDVELLGFNPELVHPKNFIIVYLPVCPPCDRPYVKADGKTCDDDLTIQYIEIIKANNSLAGEEHNNGGKYHRKREQTEQDRIKARASLRFRIMTTFNNSLGKAKHTTNGRPIKGIKERLTGKEGQIRGNLLGKRCCAPKTDILMWDGTKKKAEFITIGDIVIGDDGTRRTVVSTTSGTDTMYTVEQSMGENYTVNCEHILTLKYIRHCKIHWRPSQGKYGGWFMSWFDRDSHSIKSKKISITEKRSKESAYNKILLVKENINTDPIFDIHIKDYISLPISDKNKLYGVKLSTPVKWDKKDVKLDPRILGMWLGSGYDNGWQFISNDTEIVQYWETWAVNNNSVLIKETKNEYSICKANDNDYHPVLTPLNNYDLINNKHIPEDYIINNIDTRLALLAGIIDTIGSVDQNGTIIRLTQTEEHKVTIMGVSRICHSLGFRISTEQKILCDSETSHETVTILSISGNLSIIPTLVPHKKCNDTKRDVSYCKINVKNAGIGKFCGFEVDRNNRFLLGDYTITHNCDQTARTVIGPDATLKLGEVGIPEEIAKILTVPVRAAHFNLGILQSMIDDGKINSIVKPDGKTVIDLKRFRRGTRLMAGDIIHRNGERIKVINGRELVQPGDKVERGGEFLDKLKPANRKYTLEIGWVVNRPLQNGDYVLLNRQPTLHKPSMLAMKVIIMKYKTFRINLSVCAEFNSDFDKLLVKNR